MIGSLGVGPPKPNFVLSMFGGRVVPPPTDCLGLSVHTAKLFMERSVSGMFVPQHLSLCGHMLAGRVVPPPIVCLGFSVILPNCSWLLVSVCVGHPTTSRCVVNVWWKSGSASDSLACSLRRIAKLCMVVSVSGCWSPNNAIRLVQCLAVEWFRLPQLALFMEQTGQIVHRT